MRPILMIYATRTGHTLRIAEHVADRLRADGLLADLIDAAQLPAEFSADRYSAAIGAASVRLGKHAIEIVRFAKEERHKLESPAVRIHFGEPVGSRGREPRGADRNLGIVKKTS